MATTTTDTGTTGTTSTTGTTGTTSTTGTTDTTQTGGTTTGTQTENEVEVELEVEVEVEVEVETEVETELEVELEVETEVETEVELEDEDEDETEHETEDSGEHSGPTGIENALAHHQAGHGASATTFGHVRSTYVLEHFAGGVQVSDPAGTTTVQHSARLQFADRSVAFDLEDGQAASNTVKLIGAAFGANAVHDRPEYVGIGLMLFDGGSSVHDVAQAAVQAMGMDDDTFIATVFQHIFARTATAREHVDLVSLLQGHGGRFSQAELLTEAANTDANAASINLVGLQQTGVEFM